MFFQSLFLVTILAPTALSCAQHNNHRFSRLGSRADNPEANGTKSDWAYEASFNWGKVNPDYSMCQTGTRQSPIALSLANGLSQNHIPTFKYDGKTTGNWYNWGYGPAFTVAHNGDWTKHPSMTYDGKTVYLKGWHIHAPADHSVGGERSRAEIHFVHVDASGKEAAVAGARLDPGISNSTFIAQLPPMIGFNEPGKQVATSIELKAALDPVDSFAEFWFYKGSLTSPPCSEGIDWFVARQILFTGVEQMQMILGASTYSARAEQLVWRHNINV